MIDEDEHKRDCLIERWKGHLQNLPSVEINDYFDLLPNTDKIAWIMEFMEPEDDCSFEDEESS